MAITKYADPSQVPVEFRSIQGYVPDMTLPIPERKSRHDLINSIHIENKPKRTPSRLHFRIKIISIRMIVKGGHEIGRFICRQWEIVPTLNNPSATTGRG